MSAFPITILGSTLQGDGVSFTVSGVFWLNAPANSILPNPAARSQVPNVSSSGLAALRAGTVVEQSFSTGIFPGGTTLAQVQAALVAQQAAAQTLLANPPLAGLVGTQYNGAAWAAITALLPAVLPGGSPPQLVTDTAFAVAFGLIPNVQSGRLTGYVATSGTAPVKIRATTYTPQGTNAQRSIVSTSASDGGAGTGALTVTINYLNTSMVLKQDTVILNGVTAVNTNQTDIAFIESIVVATTGSNLANVGTISLMTGLAGAGTAWASIAPLDNQTFYAHHYVPAGVTCYLLTSSASSTVVAGRTFITHSGNPTAVNLPMLGIGGYYAHAAGGPADEHTFGIPLAVQGPDLIVMQDIPNAVTASVSYGTMEWLQF